MRPLKPYNSYGFRDVRNVMSPSFLHSQGPPGPPGPSFDVVNKLFDYPKLLLCIVIIYSFVLFHYFSYLQNMHCMFITFSHFVAEIYNWRRYFRQQHVWSNGCPGKLSPAARISGKNPDDAIKARC